MSSRAALPLVLALACVGAVGAAFTCQSTPAIAVSNCVVLGELYSATNGAAWTNNSGWVTAATGTSTDYCTFRGVGCSGDGVISSLCVPARAATLFRCACARAALRRTALRPRLHLRSAAIHRTAPALRLRCGLRTRLTDAPPAAQPAFAQQPVGYSSAQPRRADYAHDARPVLQRAHRDGAPCGCGALPAMRGRESRERREQQRERVLQSGDRQRKQRRRPRECGRWQRCAPQLAGAALRGAGRGRCSPA